jgi:putative nucleotidyltransferase with HDIG domain
LRYHVALVFLGIVFAVLFKYSHGLSLLIIVPIWFSVQSFKNVHLLRKETVDAVLKLAESIDYRDTGTSEHSQRLTDLTQRLATALGLTLETVNQVILAARVHDLGKIGISNDILLKTGPLTDEERLVMQEHTVIGANILAAYAEFQESVPIVRHHHERWDGRGYPDGLRGEEIPLGSRIITVVDSFDAMTSDRPYRQGMPVATAVERLKDGMGTQFDPRVCATFIEMLIEEGSYSPPESATTYLRLVSERAG